MGAQGCLSGTLGPTGETAGARGRRLSIPGGHPTSSSPAARFPGYSLVSWSPRIYFCIWFGRISVAGITTTFFFSFSSPPIGRFYKPEQLPEAFQEKNSAQFLSRVTVPLHRKLLS